MAYEEQKAVVATKAVDLRYFIHNNYHHFIFPPSQVENTVQVATMALLVSGSVQKSIGYDYTLLPDELAEILDAVYANNEGQQITRLTIIAGFDGEGVDVNVYPNEVFVTGD